jgi:hypothetical protein
MRSLACHILEPISESWADFLGHSLSMSQKIERKKGSKIGINVGHANLNPGSSYATLASPTHPGRRS